MSRSIATDYYSGRELAKTLAIIGAINGIAPVVSPVVGGVVSTFTIQNHYSYSPLIFSICFAVNSVFIGIGSGLSVKIKRSKNAAMAGSVVLLVTCICQLVVCSLSDSFFIYEASTLLVLTGLGYLFTASTTLAMSEGREYVGSASAIFGAMGFLFGGVISPIVGIGSILHSTMAVMLVCSVIIIILAAITFRRKETGGGAA